MPRSPMLVGALVCIAVVGGCARDTPTSALQQHEPPPRIPVAHYVSPTGTATASGTLEAPWDLQTAFSGGTSADPVLAGDTVWLLGGDYISPGNNGEFDVTVTTGTRAQHIVFRKRAGETTHAVLKRASANSGFGASGVTLNVSRLAQYTEFWDFEITTDNTSRSTTDPDLALPDVVTNYASHTKFVNLVIHDGGVAFLSEGENDATPAPVDVLISGCIIYNFGWDRDNIALAQGAGHGLYLKSSSSPDLIVADNVIFNGFGYGIQIYSDHGLSVTSHIQVTGNVLFNNGILSTHGTAANLGNLGEEAGNYLRFERNMLYYSPSIDQRNLIYRETGALFGDEDIDPVGVNNIRSLNYVIGGTWPVEGGDAGWQAAAEDFTAAVPSGVTYFLRQTAADPARANLVIYGDGSPTATVDLSGFLKNGETYEIRNVQDFRASVTTAIYNGPISVDLVGVTPAEPNGWPAPPSTGPAFNAFVVTVR